jgi:hypothetical protein
MLMARRLLEQTRRRDLWMPARALDRPVSMIAAALPWFMRMLVNLGLNKQKTR